jgi:hypothetical protein
MRYEWDEAKNLRNQRKHDGISFELAALVFEDKGCLVYADRIDSKTEEQRWHAIGAAQIEPGAGAVVAGCSRVPGGLSWRRNHPHHLGPRG